MSARRTSFHFSGDAMAQLLAIRSRTHISDNAEIIRNALNAYDELVGLAADGYQMFVRDSKGDRWPYSPYVKLSYPGLKRDALNAEAAGAAKKTKANSFFFSGEIIKKIESLRRRSHMTSNADAIRVALSAFKELILVAETGDSFYVRDPSGNEFPFSPFQPFQRRVTALEVSE